MLAMVRGEKTAKHYPANHCRRKNEPKLRVNNSIDSHVILHGRPWVLIFSGLESSREPVDAMSQGRGTEIGAEQALR